MSANLWNCLSLGAVMLALCSFAGVESCDIDGLVADLQPSVAQSLVTDARPQPPTITILDYNIVCLTTDTVRGLYNYASVVVNYTCDGLNCHEPDSESTVSQIDYFCSTRWSQGFFVTTPADANLTTPLMRTCRSCHYNAPNINHCFACDRSCVGLMECTRSGADNCCNVINELSRCDLSCPSHLVPNSNFICVHPAEISGAAIQSYRLGDAISLNCSTSVGSINSTQWLKNGVELVGETSGNLQIASASTSDGGNYTCEVNTTSGEAFGSVTIYISPEFAAQPDNVSVFNGSMTAVTCEASAYPPPIYTWIRVGNQPIRDGIINSSSVLRFNPALFGDEGDYYCNATSGGVTIQSRTITISVYPLAVAPSNRTYNHGDDINLICIAMGGPGNTIQWQDSSNFTLTSSSTLTLLNVSSADEGVYTCVVSNAAGTSKANTSVMVLPYFTTQPQNVEGMNRSSVALSCEVDDTYNPVYTWSRVDGRLLGSNLMGQNMPLLMFSPILFGDEGEYICSVEARGMIIQSQSATLSVAPLAMVPANQIYSQGQAETLTCTTLGGPDNNFQWLLNSSVLSSETTSTLRLQSISAANGGDYTCLVSNRAGSSNATTSIFVSPYFPSQPQNVGGVNGTMTTLSCAAEAFPNPTYQWSREDGKAIRPEIMGRNSATLMFQPLLFDDEGDYVCTAISNGNQASSQPLTLTISPAGSISVSSASINSEQGRTEELVCTAQGGPGNTFAWTRLDDNSVVGRSATVRVTVMSASEGDMYQCTVANTAGNDMVQVALNVAPYITTFTVPPCTVPRGGIANLRCVADGYPLPSVTWLKDGNMLTSDDRNRVTLSTSTTRVEVTSTVEVYSATSADSGNYSCRVESSVPEYSVVVRSANVAVHDPSALEDTTSSSEIGATSESPSISYYFQLRLVGVLDCMQWTNTDTIARRAEFIQVILEELNRRCQCGMESSDITNAGFQCFPASPSAVTFRAKITLQASETIGFLEEWIASGAVISVQAQLLSADRNCAVQIQSFGEPECRQSFGESTTPMLEQVSGGTVPTAYLVGVIIAAVVVILLIIIPVVVVFVLLRFKSSKTTLSSPKEFYENKSVILRDLSRIDTQQSTRPTLPPVPEDPPFYDTINPMFSGTKDETGAQDYTEPVITASAASHQASDDDIDMMTNLSYSLSRHPR